MFEAIAFYFFAALTLALFAISVFCKNVLYALTALAGGMIFLSAFFFLLNAEFLGVVQIIVYTGAVMVLYGFSMMFFDAAKTVNEHSKSYKLIFTLGILISLLLVVIFVAPVMANNIQKENIVALNDVEAVGILIFTRYLVAFELAALMLLVAMICGIVLAHKHMEVSLNLEGDR